jgi:phenylalanyl-tRNA synthetase alpha chain
LAFWVPDTFEENSFMECVRGVAGDLVESVKLIDRFENKKKGRTSHCYRINYR